MDVNLSVPGTPHKSSSPSRNLDRNQLFLSLLLTSSCQLFISRVMMTNIRLMASRRSFSKIMPSMASWAFCSNGNTANIHQDHAGPLGLLCKRKEDKISTSSRSLFSMWSSVPSTWARIKCCLLSEVYWTIHAALKPKAYFLKSFLSFIYLFLAGLGLASVWAFL